MGEAQIITNPAPPRSVRTAQSTEGQKGPSVKSSFIKWIPAVAIPAVVVAAAVIIPTTADASPQLSQKSAQQVLELVAGSVDTQFSGTVEQSSDLGLPQLPSVGPRASGSVATTAVDALTGSHTARVFVGVDRASRVQVMDTLAERDVVRNGNDLWLYDSNSNETTHVSVAADVEDVLKNAALDQEVQTKAQEQATLHGLVLPTAGSTPAELATALLAAVEPSTAIAVGDTARVAGRPVYQLTLTPKTGSDSTPTLIASVTLSVDAETGLPLAITVMAVGQDAPAESVAFSAIDFTAPDASIFQFTPPADSTITEKPITAADVTELLKQRDSAGAAGYSEPTVVGKGWGSILVIPADLVAAGPNVGSVAPSTLDGATVTDLKIDKFASMNIDQATKEKMAAQNEAAMRLLDRVTTPVDGGRVLQTSLVSVYFAADGRVLVGAVGADALVAAAAQ